MIVFTFPGQGSQREGMGRAWSDHPSWEVVEEASAATGRDIARLLLDATMDELTATENAQVATFVHSMVVLDAIERVGLSPSGCAGHSLGEYSALVAAGALSFADGARLVAARGLAMSRAASARPGTMAAVMGLDDEAAQAACASVGDGAWVANYNAPGQVVIAGTLEGVAAASTAAREAGAKRVLSLPVSGAFHTALMAPARDDLRSAIGASVFHRPEVPVVANIDAAVHDDASEWPAVLTAQLVGAVRWRQCVETLVASGATSLVEAGPGGVLTGLAKRIAPEVQALSVATPDDLDALLAGLSGRSDVAEDVHEGEHLFISERVVVSPVAGLFSPEPTVVAPATGLLEGTDTSAAPGSARVSVGDSIGVVGDVAVRTPFAGRVVRWLCVEGERVQEGQPLVWLRVEEAR